jgi:hypothetical protein
VGGREAGDGTPCLNSEFISSTNLKPRFSFFAFAFSSNFERREADARINGPDLVQCEGHVMGIIVSTDANDPTSSPPPTTSLKHEFSFQRSAKLCD